MFLKKQSKIFKKTQVISLVIILFLGFFFRFANLGDKIFWVDEVSTAIRVSGYTIPEVTNELQQQDIVGIDVLNSYQTITSNKNFKNSWNAFKKSPEHAPLYFLLTRLWLQLWGNSITVMRSLSTLFGLLIFPGLYWLCQELFNKPSVSILAVMLMNVSPFYVAYAQEARPYSLWTLTILLMGASFLRAIRLNTWQSWLLYSFSSILAFYTSLFSLYIVFFQGIYLLSIPLKKKLEKIKSYLLFTSLSLLAFSPWLLIIIRQINLLNENTSWMREALNPADIVAVFVGTVLLIFGDLPMSQVADPIQIAIALIFMVFFLAISVFLGFRWRNAKSKSRLVLLSLFFFIPSSLVLFSNYIYFDFITTIGVLVALCILFLSTYSLYFLIANNQCNRWKFIITLMISVPLPLILVDIINQGQSSATPRYLIPLQLGIQIAVAYTLASKIEHNQPERRASFWKITTIMFLSLGVFSCTRNLNLSPIYQKTRNIHNPAIAEIINRTSSSLVIVESINAIDALSLAYSLSANTKFKAIDSNVNLLKYINNYNNIFILKPSSELKQKLQQDTKINFQQVYQPYLLSENENSLELWLISKANNY